ncbi:hypothetical protein [Gordonia sp. (in: high G+C Gram-positive bacteria)]|uniref:hypothetical protein n=1 Tax=Gordonia sp. (in: high G+C Gram-positive bacteria) TaxID=84139 RepID=UPI0033428215
MEDAPLPAVWEQALPWCGRARPASGMKSLAALVADLARPVTDASVRDTLSRLRIDITVRLTLEEP